MAAAGSGRANVVEAIGRYREALRLRPRWADAHNNLGLALRALGDTSSALEQFRRAVRVWSDHIEARNNLGVTLSDRASSRRRRRTAVAAAKALRQICRRWQFLVRLPVAPAYSFSYGSFGKQ